MPSPLHAYAASLQTTDPLFPIGSYAHSYGLEELTANGCIHDVDTLLNHLLTNVALNLSEFELPYLRFQYKALKIIDSNSIASLDEELNASKLSKELRTASSSQGIQRLRLLAKLRPSPRIDALQELKREKRILPHHITVFAAEYADLELPLEQCLAAWTYQALAAPCAASFKLIRIGQEGAQTVLTKSLHHLEAIVERSLGLEREFAGAFHPSLDIASYRHAHAYSRLFIS